MSDPVREAIEVMRRAHGCGDCVKDLNHAADALERAAREPVAILYSCKVPGDVIRIHSVSCVGTCHESKRIFAAPPEGKGKP